MTKNSKLYKKNSLFFENSKVNEYLDIPYAQAPINELRFLPPKPLTKDYSFPNKPSFLCPQISNNNWETVKGENISSNKVSENCLVLNIWQPKITNGGVLVILHSGSFPFVSQSVKLLNGSYFAYKTGSIVVTVSYRVGVLGFARLYNDKLLSGNIGLLDQQLALKWIYKNIENFNGDANKITLFGEGVGAILASSHLYSKESSTYFKRIILFHDHTSILTNVINSKKLETNTAALLEDLKCNNKYYKDYLTCLQKAKISNIFKSVGKIKKKFNYMLTNPFVISQEDNLFFKQKIEKKIMNNAYKKDVDIFIGSLTNNNFTFIINQFLDYGCYFNAMLSNVHCLFNEEQSFYIFKKVIHKMLRMIKYKEQLKYYIKRKLEDKIRMLVSKYFSNYTFLNFIKTFSSIFKGKLYSSSMETKLPFQEYPYQDEITDDELLKYIFGFYCNNPADSVDKNIKQRRELSLKIMLLLSQFIVNGNVNKTNFSNTLTTNEKINPKGIVIKNFS
uniref:COesterase domain-containing protein n=1 Tax=Strongyloides papillosus TaxID=174720 RepID=A0A0N5CBS1_STREA